MLSINRAHLRSDTQAIRPFNKNFINCLWIKEDVFVIHQLRALHAKTTIIFLVLTGSYTDVISQKSKPPSNSSVVFIVPLHCKNTEKKQNLKGFSYDFHLKRMSVFFGQCWWVPSSERQYALISRLTQKLNKWLIKQARIPCFVPLVRRVTYYWPGNLIAI